MTTYRADFPGVDGWHYLDTAASAQKPQAVIEAVKARLDSVRGSLPAGVEIVTVYDRSSLIERAGTVPITRFGTRTAGPDLSTTEPA